MPQELIAQFDRKYALPIETYRQVLNITLLNSIPNSIRWLGMIVYVISESKSYELVGVSDNSGWTELGSLVNITVRNNLTSTSTTDALSANQGRLLNENKLSDAPIDGSQYARKNGSWDIISGGGSTAWVDITGKPTTVGGYGITDYNSLGDVRWLGISAKAADSDLLDGVSWGNVNTDIISSNSLTVDGGIAYTQIANKRTVSSVEYGSYLAINGSSGAAIWGYDDGIGGGTFLELGSSFRYYDGSGYNTVWTSGNDGSGSGLDADLLDGVSWGNVNTNIVTTGTATATNFILSSDKRLKNKIKNLTAKNIAIDWKQFELKSDPGQKRYGVIAQELELNYPEFVRTDEKGFKSVAYIDLLILKISELENRIIKLESNK